MDVPPPLEANAQLAKACKPSMRSLHHSAMRTQPLAALEVAFGNLAGDVPLLQVGAATRVVLALASTQLRWPATRLAVQTPDGLQSIDAFLKHHRIVPIHTTDQHYHQNVPRHLRRRAAGAELAAVRGAGTFSGSQGYAAVVLALLSTKPALVSYT